MGDILSPFFIGFLMKIGFDFHNVINTNYEYFSNLIKKYRNYGYEIHIITGSSIVDLYPTLLYWDIQYDVYFSISDWCLAHSRTVKVRDDGHVFDNDDIWNNAKAEYCMRDGIDIHIDDSMIYRETFKNIKTHFFLYNQHDDTIQSKMEQTIKTMVKFKRNVILCRDKLRNILLKSTIFKLASDHWADITDKDLPQAFIDELVNDVYQQIEWIGND